MIAIVIGIEIQLERAQRDTQRLRDRGTETRRDTDAETESLWDKFTCKLVELSK